MTSLYTYGEQRTIFWAPKLPGFISVLCSALVASLLIRDRKSRLNKVYGRLWLGLSVGNILVAIMAILSGTPAPKGTFYGAMGTKETCTVAAVFFHFAFVLTMIYNGSLATYYYISVHTKWSDDFVKRRVEPLLHLLAFCFPVLGIAFGLIYNMYGPHDIFLNCWASPSPYGCREDDSLACSSGYHLRSVFVLLAALVELNLFTSTKIAAVFAIYFTFAKQQKMMKAKYVTRSTHCALARETLIQAFLFLLACLIPYTLMILLRSLDIFWINMPHQATRAFYLFSLIAHTLFPVQGITNLVIFFRPKLRQRRKECPDETMWQSLRSLLDSPDSPSSRPSKARKNPPSDATSATNRTSTSGVSNALHERINKDLGSTEYKDQAVASESFLREQQTESEGTRLPIGGFADKDTSHIDDVENAPGATEEAEEAEVADEDVQEEDALGVGMVPGEDLRGEVVRRFCQRRQHSKSDLATRSFPALGARTDLTGALEVLHEQRNHADDLP